MTAGTKSRGWTFARPVWLLGLVSLLTDTATEAVYPLLPILLQGLGASGGFAAHRHSPLSHGEMSRRSSD